MKKSVIEIFGEVFSDIMNKMKEDPIKYLQEVEKKVENNEKMLKNTSILLSNQIKRMKEMGMIEEADNFRKFIKKNHPKINLK